MPKTKKRPVYTVESDEYAVVKFYENCEKLFECIPHIWFTSEDKTSCYWPPAKGKPLYVKALKREIPDKSWGIHNCEVVQEGLATYSMGRAIMMEKCQQPYNTSSADDHIFAANFRRLHPVLSLEKPKSFDDVFTASKTDVSKITEKNKNKNSKQNSRVEVSADLSTMSPERFKSGRFDLPAHYFQIHSANDTSTRYNLNHKQSTESRKRRTTSIQNKSNASNDRYSRSNSIQTESKSTCNGRSKSNSSRSSSNSSNDRRSRSNSIKTKSKSPCNRRTISKSSRSSSNSSNDRRSRSNSIQTKSKPSNRRTKSKSSRSSSNSSNDRRSRSNSIKTKSKSPCNGRSKSKSSRSSSNASNDRRSRSNSIQTKSKPSNRHTKSKSSRSSSNSSNDRRSRSKSIKTKSKSPCNGRSKSKSSRSSSNASNDRRSRSNNIQTKSKPSNRRTKSKSSTTGCLPSCESKLLLHKFIRKIDRLEKTINETNRQNDRRLTRMEVTINKTFIRLGDVCQSNNNTRRRTPEPYDYVFRNDNTRREFKVPDFPIMSGKELADLTKKLKNPEFKNILVDREKEFCTPNKTKTNNVVMNAYLKRFISLDVRKSITFKDAREVDDKTLYSDFHQVYLFLIEVMRAGYKSCGKDITVDNAHLALRICWGRTKQIVNEELNKRCNYRSGIQKKIRKHKR